MQVYIIAAMHWPPALAKLGYQHASGEVLLYPQITDVPRFLIWMTVLYGCMHLSESPRSVSGSSRIWNSLASRIAANVSNRVLTALSRENASILPIRITTNWHFTCLLSQLH